MELATVPSLINFTFCTKNSTTLSVNIYKIVYKIIPPILLAHPIMVISTVDVSMLATQRTSNTTPMKTTANEMNGSHLADILTLSFK